MSRIKTIRTFPDLFDTDRPLLKVKFDVRSGEEATEVPMEHMLEKKADAKGLARLSALCTDTRLHDFADFYSRYDGFSLGTAAHPGNIAKKTLLRQLPVSDLVKFTRQYLPDGAWAWTIDLNKTKALYSGAQKWLAFATIDEGPACLTIFLDGEHAGNVFLVTPQPPFNTLKPIAKTFSAFLERIAKDPAAFFRLIRAYVIITGEDKQDYGYVPVAYIDSHESDTKARTS